MISSVACSLDIICPIKLLFRISNNTFELMIPFSGEQNSRCWFASNGNLPIASTASLNPETQSIVCLNVIPSRLKVSSGFQAPDDIEMADQLKARQIVKICSDFFIRFKASRRGAVYRALTIYPYSLYSFNTHIHAWWLRHFRWCKPKLFIEVWSSVVSH